MPASLDMTSRVPLEVASIHLLSSAPWGSALTDVNLSTAIGSPLVFGCFNGVSIWGMYETYETEGLWLESIRITLSGLSNSFDRSKLWAVPLLEPSQKAITP